VDNEQVPNLDGVKPQQELLVFLLGINLRYRYPDLCKKQFSDSFGVDRKVTKQLMKRVCLGLAKEDHQDLMSSGPLWGSASVSFWSDMWQGLRACFRRIGRRIHGPPPLDHHFFQMVFQVSRICMRLDRELQTVSAATCGS
jgi:hypothetical protein